MALSDLAVWFKISNFSVRLTVVTCDRVRI